MYPILFPAEVAGLEPANNGFKVRCLSHLATPQLRPRMLTHPGKVGKG